jgi:hypothetical membrane protein
LAARERPRIQNGSVRHGQCMLISEYLFLATIGLVLVGVYHTLRSDESAV